MFLEWGFVFTHEAVREWEERFTPLLTQHLRAKRRGKAGRSWYVDETYIKVHGRCYYLSRAIDRDGNLVDSLLSATRDRKAARRFFRGARAVVGHAPDRSRRTGTTPTPARSAGHSAARSSTAAVAISTIAWNKTTEASSNAPIRCTGSGASRPPHASARRLTNSVITSGLDRGLVRKSAWPRNGACFATGGPPCCRCRPRNPRFEP
jgi:hypothetical protein